MADIHTQRGGMGAQGGTTAQGREQQGTVGAIKEKAQDVASAVGERAEQAWDATRRYVGDAASAVADQAEAAWDTVSDFFHRYPIPMFFVGMGLGFLMALAFTNMSGDMTRRMSEASNRGHY
jgi:ElaB/YqjD/DUF883 family membrane-anchored ribosome-binding protein